MNLHPLGMKGVLYVNSYNANMRAYRRKVYLVLVVATCRLGVCLSHRKLADDFEYQVSALSVVIAGVQQILKLGVHFEPTVGIPIPFVTNSTGFLAIGRVHDRSCYRNTLLMDDQTGGVIHVAPQGIVALTGFVVAE